MLVAAILLVTAGAAWARSAVGGSGYARLGTLLPADGSAPPTVAPGTPTPGAGPTSAPARGTARPATPCPLAPPECDPAVREAVARYLSGVPGSAGIVIRDRVTGRVWRAGDTRRVTWTASTIKLAIAASVLERARAGQIRLTATDRTNLAAMLRTSSNPAADALWRAYGADGMVARFRGSYGMTGIVHVPGDQPVWRGYKCSTEDLLNLVSYVLERLHPADRAYLVTTLRTVASNQRWGVWAAGPRLAPGNKDGWAEKPDPGGAHWVIRSVGFAGPGERYAVAVSNDLPPGAGMARGIHAVSDLVALAFGAPAPAPVSLP